MKLDINEMAVGDVLSEISHYTLVDRVLDNGTPMVKLKHIESDTEVFLDEGYVTTLLSSADQYEKEVIVGLEDKYFTKKQIEELSNKNELADLGFPKEGDLRLAGIRSIFENIYNGTVFTAIFQKKDTKLTAKKFKELRDKQIEEAVAEIESTAKSKKGVAEISKIVAKRIQDNPIFLTVPGELRTLRGYKVQFSSRDGHYNCVDMDLPKGDSGVDNVRPVNISTLKEIIYEGVRYIVE